jgi:hypothetical protein
MRNDELAYYRSRAMAEAKLVECAAHPKAIAAHHELANAYFERAGGFAAEERADHV